MKTSEIMKDIYSDVAGVFITQDGETWEVSSPEETTTYSSEADLIDGIRKNLEIIREIYKDNGEAAEWNEIVSRWNGAEWLIR